MNTIIYGMLEIIANIHSNILTLNDAYEYNFTDKQLHFIVVGLFGLLMIFFIHPLFKLLAKTNHVMIISWLYVFTVILMMTFAIEVGQKLTGTGVMDFEDATSGISGFLIVFLIFAVIRGIIKGIISLVKGAKKRKRKER